jgi:ribosome biogenesis GTPase
VTDRTGTGRGGTGSGSEGFGPESTGSDGTGAEGFGPESSGSWWDDGDEDEELDRYDESSIRSRPNPKGNRPRTKTRPGHTDAEIARVHGVDRGRYTILLDEDTDRERQVTAARASELRRNPIVTGDRVAVVGDTTGEEGTLARIVRVEPRTTLLRRSADDTDEVERIVVANADQMLIVVAAANPEPRTRLVDRYLVAAYDAGIEPMLCVTKTDLADPEPFLANFAGLGLPVFTSREDDIPLREIAAALVGHDTVVVGHSGVGKSTLVNALVPGARRATGHVNVVTGRGRHTSSSTVSLRIEDGAGHHGWVIDTPGVRSFGLGHVNTDSILKSFTDLAAIAEDCPRGCTHLPDAPDCAIIEAVEEGRLGEAGRARLDSLQRLLTTFAR